MRLTELDKYRIQHPQLSELFPKLEDYLFSIAEQKNNPDIVPIILAKRLSIDEGLALVMLMLSDKAGLLKPSYQVYCVKSDNFLAEYQTLKEIPSEIFCDFDNELHSAESYKVELIFHFTQLFNEKYQKITAMV